MAQGNFFAELKRRNVYRAGAAYALAAFAVIEIVSNVAPMFDLPGWIGRGVVLLLIVGFPAVLGFAWVYEITPDGLKRTVEVEKDASVTHQTGHRLNIVIIALMLVLAGLYGADRFLLRHDVAGTAPKAPAGEDVSIAVLPFVNLSGDPGQEFFSDGMTEEITSALAKVKGLRVVGRTSAFEFKGQNKDLRAIGQALGTANLLEGSVRKVGNRVRITGQLIRAGDGSHIWTENYDRELTDIFATQDDIARAIAAALQTPLGLKAGETLVAARAIDSESYQQYLRAKALFRSRGVSGKPITQAADLLEKVVAADPTYAPAWALLGQVYATLPQENPQASLEEDRSFADTYLSKSRAAGREAIRLDPGNPDAYVGAGNHLVFRGSLLEMEDLFRHALELDPYCPEALHGLSQQLLFFGLVKEAQELRQRLLSVEPLVPRYNSNAGNLLETLGQTEAAIAVIKALPPNFGGRATGLARNYAALGRYSDAADAMASAPAGAFPPGVAAAAAALLRRAPATVPPQELPVGLAGGAAFAYAYVGAADRFAAAALDALERSLDVGYRANAPLFALTLPMAAPARKTERFKALVRRYGLVDYWRARGWPAFCHPVGADDFACE